MSLRHGDHANVRWQALHVLYEYATGQYQVVYSALHRESRTGPHLRDSARGDSKNHRGPPEGGRDGRPSDSPLLAGRAGPVVYRLSKPSERAEVDSKVENWGAKCYQATVELFDPPRVLTEEMLRDYLARFREHIEVDEEEYGR